MTLGEIGGDSVGHLAYCQVGSDLVKPVATGDGLGQPYRLLLGFLRAEFGVYGGVACIVESHEPKATLNCGRPLLGVA